MIYDPKKHNRRSIRLKGYDYSQSGLYFITFCVRKRLHLFGKIIDGKMIFNDAGKMANEEWLSLATRFNNIQLHEFITMPNHFHGILEILPPSSTGDPCGRPSGRPNNRPNPHERSGQPQGIAPTEITPIEIKITPTLGEILGAFKSITTVKYTRGVKNGNWPRFHKKLWQRNYWEHIIQTEKTYKNISNYIINNPEKWWNDKFFQ